jgi:tetratricopeptide (TPR) repeat protein
MDSHDAGHHSATMGQFPFAFQQLEDRALRFEGAQRLEEARAAFDAALELNPTSQSCAEGRARIALALGEEGAAEICIRALAFHDDNPERQLRMIATAAAELGTDAIPLLEDFIRRNPENATAHELLSEIRAESGAGDGFIESYISALAERPRSKPLLISYWNTLTRAGRLNDALDSMDASRSIFEGDRDFVLLEVNIANHAGLTERAGVLIHHLDDCADASLARGQHLLQVGQVREAAKLLEAVVHAEPDNLSAWALVELAWRILDDPRHAWLIGQSGLYGTRELALDRSQLEKVASTLRTLHRAHVQPIGQSVRGGTQTAGQLFLRREPEIVLLADALAAAIRDFVAQLPDADPRHPLLKHRNMGMAFGPSWSVRLTGGGYHSAHFHPNGILSSACYITLPEAVADRDSKQGWLELGRPPAELAIDLEPLATIQPEQGRLVLFPSFLFHGTRVFGGGERLSVAFDLVPVPMDA